MDSNLRFSRRVISGAAVRGMGGAAAWHFGRLEDGDHAFADEDLPDGESHPPTMTAADVDAAHTRGFTEGLKAGFANAQQHYEAELAKQQDALKGPIEAFCAQFHALDADVAEALMRMAIDLARNVVRHEITANPTILDHALKEGLAYLGEAARGARVSLNPADYARFAADCSRDLSDYSLNVVADPRIDVGGCVIDAGSTKIDATLSRRWQAALAPLGRADPLD